LAERSHRTPRPAPYRFDKVLGKVDAIHLTNRWSTRITFLCGHSPSSLWQSILRFVTQEFRQLLTSLSLCGRGTFA
jgi:hypothetical protein